MKGKINEIFESIQGEGMYVGERQIFVRLAGCNIACAFCDTDTSAYKEYEPQEVLDEVKKFKGHFHSVSFTGGEPLLQKDFLKELLVLTRKHGFRNYLDTNGTLPEQMRDVAAFVDIVAMDFKLPSSTGLKSFWGEHLEFLKVCERNELFIKAVIGDATNETDILESVKTIKAGRLHAILVLQPDSASKDKQLVSRILESFRMLCHRSGIAACVIPQMHKVIGVK
jgi:7-carboxy-7-deazaguanine synthase